MAEFVRDLFARVTSNESFLRCLRLCEIEQFSELISLNESTFDQMELYIQKKCSQMPFNDRLEFIGINFAKNPSSFRFSPGIRQKILSLTNNLCTVFVGDNLEVVNASIVRDICERFVGEQQTMSRVRLPAVGESVGQVQERCGAVDRINIDLVDDAAVVADFPSRQPAAGPGFTNIFQQLDMMSKQFIANDRPVDNINAIQSFSPNNNDSNKENADKIERNVSHKKSKHKLEQAPNIPRKYNFSKKRKTKGNAQPDYYQHEDSRSGSSDIRIYKATRSRSQHFNNNVIVPASEPITQQQTVTTTVSSDQPRIKRKYTKRAKLAQTEIRNSDDLPPDQIASEALVNNAIEGNPMENHKPISVEPVKTFEISPKLDQIDSQLPNVSKNDIETPPETTPASISIPSDKIPIKLISTNSQLTKGVPPPKSVKVILQSKPSNSSITLTKPARVTELVNENMLASDPIIPQQPLAAGDKQKPPLLPRLQLSDAPFQCFEPNLNRKKHPVKKHPTKLTNGVQSNLVKLVAQPKPLPSGLLIKPAGKESEPVPMPPLLPVCKQEPIQIDTAASPARANLFEQLLDASIDPNMNPQWTSTPYFNANRFINSTKHQKQISSSEDSRTVDGAHN